MTNEKISLKNYWFEWVERRVSSPKVDSRKIASSVWCRGELVSVHSRSVRLHFICQENRTMLCLLPFETLDKREAADGASPAHMLPLLLTSELCAVRPDTAEDEGSCS